MENHVPSSPTNIGTPGASTTATPLSRRKKVIFYILVITLPYLITELLFSTLYVYGIIYPPDADIFVYENIERTIRFDPVRGYRLTSTPSRFARIGKGTIEFVGTFRGNAQGFPDRDDFSPERGDSTHANLRLAVFGDSFTANQRITQNWPDTLEDMAARSGNPVAIELLNFSLESIGLANWWSMLIHIVKQEAYEIDGLLFAVYGNNLHRIFSFYEQRGYPQPMLGWVASWNPEEWPKNIQEARTFLQPLGAYSVSRERFMEAINGNWQYLEPLDGKFHPDYLRPWRPYFFRSLWEAMKILIDPGSGNRPVVAPVHPDTFNRGQMELIRQISVFSSSNSLPVIVAYVPSREESIAGNTPPRDILLFSRLLDATFIDGTEAFSGLTEEEIRSCYFRVDGHWNQGGSDKFARLIFAKLEQYISDGLLAPAPP